MKMPLRVLSICAALSFGLLGCLCAPVLAKPSAVTVDKKAQLETDRLIKSGLAKKAVGDYRGCLLDLTRALKIMPGHANALLERADIYVKLNRLPEARTDCESVIALEPKYAEAYCEYGMIIDRQGERSKAIEVTDYAVKLDPRSKSALADRVFLYLKRGMDREALMDAEAIIRFYPECGQGHTLKAYCLWFMGDNAQALSEVDEGIKLVPSSYLSHNVKREILQKLFKYSDALAEAKIFRALCPQYADGALQVGQLKVLTGDRKGGFESFENAIALDPLKSYDAILRFCISYGDPAGLYFANRALALYPVSSELLHLRESIFHNHQRFDRMISDADKACLLDPTFSQYAALSGTVHYLSGDKAGGIAQFENAIKLNPAKEYGSIVAFLTEQKDPRAFEFANRAIAAFPKRADLYFVRADFHAWNNNWTAVLRDAETVLALDPKGIPYAYEMRFNALMDLKRFDEALSAIDDYEKVTALPLRVLEWKGSLLLDKHEYLAAKRVYDQTIKVFPTAHRYLKRSSANYNLGLYDEAIADARAAMNLEESGIAKGLRMTCMAHFRQGNLIAASSEYLASLVAVFTPGVKP